MSHTAFHVYSVCLLAISHKNNKSALYANITRDVAVDKEELIKFWKLSAICIWIRIQEFYRTLQHCEIGNFPTIWLISLEKRITSSRKFYHRCNFGQGSRS